jgi:hypothetical protein
MNLKYLSIPLALMISGSASAEIGKLVVNGANGSKTPYAITGQTRLTVGPGTITITDSQSAPVEIAIAEIEKITFDFSTSSIEDVASELGDGVAIEVHGPVVRIIPSGGTPVSYGAYSVNGLTVTTGTAAAPVEIDFSTYSPGLYIIRANNKTVKYVNK